MRSIRDAEVDGKRVLVRVDFNVPLENGRVADDSRIVAAIPTIELLREHGARVVLMSHLGRPKGEVVDNLSLEPVAERLGSLLGTPVGFVDDIAGDRARQTVQALQRGDALLLQNLRFDPGEEKNDLALAERLGALGDLYCDDAFGAAHRAHASTQAITRVLPAYAGLLLQREIDVLSSLVDDPARPFVVILGGAKVSDKFGVIERLIPMADTLIIGGGMANTFLLAQGREVGRSLVETDLVNVARRVLMQADAEGTAILLPTDVRVATSIDQPARVVDVAAVKPDEAIFDIGPATSGGYADAIQGAATIFWNGPMGVFEQEAFSSGTRDVAVAVGASSGTSIVGGGDSIAAVQQMGLSESIDHLSTGGGASLEFLEGRTLPGIAAIPDASQTT